jgi:hypothetical protein
MEHHRQAFSLTSADLLMEELLKLNPSWRRIFRSSCSFLRPRSKVYDRLLERRLRSVASVMDWGKQKELFCSLWEERE